MQQKVFCIDCNKYFETLENYKKEHDYKISYKVANEKHNYLIENNALAYFAQLFSNNSKIVDIINSIPENYKHKLTPYLKVKPVRTASGVAVVAVMCKPHRCPHIALTGSTCIYCPGGPDSDFEYSTQSYTGYEPTSMRAIRARYDPYLQAKDRIEQLKKLGHDCDKVEYVLMGGTFMSLPSDYRDYFIRNLHDALSGLL